MQIRDQVKVDIFDFDFKKYGRLSIMMIMRVFTTHVHENSHLEILGLMPRREGKCSKQGEM